jgi:hypothetical protein
MADATRSLRGNLPWIFYTVKDARPNAKVFAHPVESAGDVVDLAIGPETSDKLISVIFTTSMRAAGILCKIATERGRRAKVLKARIGETNPDCEILIVPFRHWSKIDVEAGGVGSRPTDHPLATFGYARHVMDARGVRNPDNQRYTQFIRLSFIFGREDSPWGRRAEGEVECYWAHDA